VNYKANDSDVLQSVDALQNAYMYALDSKNMAGWLACFSQDGAYICNSRENVEQGLPLAIMMDDNVQRRIDRVRYINEVWAGTFEDYVTRHFVQRVSHAVDGERITVHSNFMVAYTNPRGQSELLVAGAYRDEIIVQPDGARFLSKTAVLDTITTPRYLVYPI
jgi:3-phenylpropionate/cinnamic acid dioxygenase small subunit